MIFFIKKKLTKMAIFLKFCDKNIKKFEIFGDFKHPPKMEVKNFCTLFFFPFLYDKQ